MTEYREHSISYENIQALLLIGHTVQLVIKISSLINRNTSLTFNSIESSTIISRDILTKAILKNTCSMSPSRGSPYPELIGFFHQINFKSEILI